MGSHRQGPLPGSGRSDGQEVIEPDHDTRPSHLAGSKMNQDVYGWKLISRVKAVGLGSCINAQPQPQIRCRYQIHSTEFQIKPVAGPDSPPDGFRIWAPWCSPDEAA